MKMPGFKESWDKIFTEKHSQEGLAKFLISVMTKDKEGYLVFKEHFKPNKKKIYDWIDRKKFKDMNRQMSKKSVL